MYAQYVETHRSRADTAREGRSKPESLRSFCKRNGYPYSSTQRHARNLLINGIPKISIKRSGRPSLLTDAEDQALVAYIMQLDKLGAYPDSQHVISAANLMRQSRIPPCGPIQMNWYGRWRKKHPELRLTKQQPVEITRLSWEQQIDLVEAWYRRTAAHAVELGITASAAWNADECGTRIGVRDGRIPVLVVTKKRHEKPRTADPANRESCTLIGGGNAVGQSLPPFCIFTKWPTSDWLDLDLPEGIVFTRSETGFSNGDIQLTWIQHFNRYSWPEVAAVQSIGSPTLKEWFGHDFDVRFDFVNRTAAKIDPNSQRAKTRIWRWLFLDGFTGHFGMEILDYCLRFDIEIVILPPHSTHYMQPMDVSVFTHLKNELQAVLHEHINTGIPVFTRSDFVAAIRRCWQTAFTTGHVISGFQDTGLFPVDGTKVLAKLRGHATAANTPRYPDSLPTAERFSRAKYAASRMAAKAHHFSSDTVDAISDLQAVANEAIILQQRVAQEQTNKQKRLQRASRYKVKMTLKSKDKQFQTANTLEDMRVAHEAKQALIEETALYQQEKFVRDAWYRDKNQAIQRWRETEGMPNGIKIQQKRYLEDLGFTPENVPAVRERPGKRKKTDSQPSQSWFVDKGPISAGNTSTQINITVDTDSACSISICVSRSSQSASPPAPNRPSKPFPRYIPLATPSPRQLQDTRPLEDRSSPPIPGGRKDELEVPGSPCDRLSDRKRAIEPKLQK